MTNNETYNGWANYETWLTNLHFDNAWRDHAVEFYNDARASSGLTKKEIAYFNLAEFIEQDLEEYLEASGAVMADAHVFIQDMVTHFLNGINYYEIAKHYIDELKLENEAS